MPPQPGESILATLFADVRYFFSKPSDLRPHHRFDRGSYVYVYRNSSENRGRLEIANCPGTSEQDAFVAGLEHASVQYNYRRSTYISITLPQVPSPEWSLPSLDPHNEKKYMYPIHGLDLYFHNPTDTNSFTDALKNVHNVGALDIVEDPSTKRQSITNVNPVIQKLEQVAVSEQKNPRRTESTSTSHSFAPPPQAPIPVSSTAVPSTIVQASQSPVSPSSVHQQQPGYKSPSPALSSVQPSPAPAPYNPAAPAAPEQIAHRQKTPPPMDAASGTGLNAAAAHDQGPQGGYMPQHQGYRPQQGGYQPYGQSQSPAQGGRPVYPLAHIGSGPPQQPQASQQPGTPPTFGAPPTQHQGYNPQAGHQSSMPAPPPLTQTASSMSFSPPPTQPVNLPPHAPQQSPQQMGYQQQQPIGGYAEYSYAQQGQAQGMNDPSAIHAQAYRPTEAEASHGKPSWGQPGPGQPQPGRIEQGASRVGKGVNRFLQKLEKKI